jgi:hypothetical protein
MTIIGRQPRLLDGKECFLLWVELGSLEKVRLHYNAQGLINPRTGKPLSEMAIWTTSLRWVLENPEEARPYYEQEGGKLSDDEWEKWLISRAVMVYNYSKNRIIRWAKRNNLFDKHYEIFRARFNLPER